MPSVVVTKRHDNGRLQASSVAWWPVKETGRPQLCPKGAGVQKLIDIPTPQQTPGQTAPLVSTWQDTSTGVHSDLGWRDVIPVSRLGTREALTQAVLPQDQTHGSLCSTQTAIS